MSCRTNSERRHLSTLIYEISHPKKHRDLNWQILTIKKVKKYYNFNKESKRNSTKELGETSINTLIINVVIPFLFVFGEKQNKHHLKNRALEFLEQLPPENNSIIKNWNKLGLKTRSAFETQSLLQLKNIYCEKKKCLNCQIGVKIVNNVTN